MWSIKGARTVPSGVNGQPCCSEPQTRVRSPALHPPPPSPSYAGMMGPHSGSLPTEDLHLLSGSRLQGGKDGAILLATVSCTCFLLMSQNSTLFHQKIILADFLSLRPTMLVAMIKQRDVEQTDILEGCPSLYKLGDAVCGPWHVEGAQERGGENRDPRRGQAEKLLSISQALASTHRPPHPAPNDANIPSTCGEVYGIAMGLDQPPL